MIITAFVVIVAIGAGVAMVWITSLENRYQRDVWHHESRRP